MTGEELLKLCDEYEDRDGSDAQITATRAYVAQEASKRTVLWHPASKKAAILPGIEICRPGGIYGDSVVAFLRDELESPRSAGLVAWCYLDDLIADALRATQAKDKVAP